MRLLTKALAALAIVFATFSANAADQSVTGDGTVMLSVWQEGFTNLPGGGFGDAASVIIDTGVKFSDLFNLGAGDSINIDVNSIFDVNTFLTNSLAFASGNPMVNIVGGARNAGFAQMFTSVESFVDSAINVELNNALNNTDLFIDRIGASGAETSLETTDFPNAFESTDWNDNWGTAFQDVDNAFDASAPVSGEMFLFQTSAQGGLNGQPLQVSDFGGLFTFAYDLAAGTLSFTNAAVPLPAAVWFLGSALLGLMGFSRRRAVAA